MPQVTYTFFALVPEGSGHVADPTLLPSITLELRWYLSHSGTHSRPTSEDVVLANVFGAVKGGPRGF